LPENGVCQQIQEVSMKIFSVKYKMIDKLSI
jgi:hypothetical protein